MELRTIKKVLWLGNGTYVLLQVNRKIQKKQNKQKTKNKKQKTGSLFFIYRIFYMVIMMFFPVLVSPDLAVK